MTMWPLPLLLPLLLATAASSAKITPPPTPTPWPEQYHTVVITNLTSKGSRLQVIDIYYDWPRGRSVNVIRDQLPGADDPPLRNVEWVNGTSYLFDAASCSTFQFDVGILAPDWTKDPGVAYLGRGSLDGFDCHVWSNFLFQRYYEDAATGVPVAWKYNGLVRHVLSFEAGVVLQDSSKWQAPAYCFNGRALPV